MSSYGLRVYNQENGDIIISNDTTTFYYYGNAVAIQATGNDTWVSGGLIVRIFNTFTSKPIIPFIKPRGTEAVSITRIFRGPEDYWYLEIAVAKIGSIEPEVLVFTTADAELWAERNPEYTKSDYGLKVLREDSSTAFDSSAGQPLGVSTAITVLPPYNPNTGGQDLSASQFSYYDVPDTVVDPMFGYYSMAMCERQWEYSRSWTDCTVRLFGACVGIKEEHYAWDLYWAFYRAGCAIEDRKAKVGWVQYSGGHQWIFEKNSSFSVFIPIVDLGGGSSAGGSGPFVNETINYTAATLLIADRSKYALGSTYVIPVPNAPTNVVATTYVATEKASSALYIRWDNALTAPFANTYNVYYRKVTDPQSEWILIGGTDTRNSGVLNIEYLDALEQAVIYEVKVVGTNILSQEGPATIVFSSPYIPLPIEDGDEFTTGIYNGLIGGNVLYNLIQQEGRLFQIQSYTIEGITDIIYQPNITYEIIGLGVIRINSDGSWTFNPQTTLVGYIPAITYIVEDVRDPRLTNTSNLFISPIPDDGSYVIEDANETAVGIYQIDRSGNLLDNTVKVLGKEYNIIEFTFNGTSYKPSLTPVNIAGVGTIMINVEGSWVFSPLPGYRGPIPVFSYTINQLGRRKTSTLTISDIPPA